MTTTHHEIEATWNAKRYVTDATTSEGRWYSIDGDNWTDDSGLAVESVRFSESTITLIGGPRDGDIVH